MKKNAHTVSDITENYRVDRERKEKKWDWWGTSTVIPQE